MLPRVCCPNLIVEFSRVFRGIPPNIEHHEIVEIGLRQKSRSGDRFSFEYLDLATSQDGSARFAHSLRVVDEENSLARKMRVATKWWATHKTPPKRARPL